MLRLFAVCLATLCLTNSELILSPEERGKPEKCLWKKEYPPQYVTYKVDHPPVIDGRLDEPVWEEVEWTDLFVDIRGPDAGVPPPRFNTRAKIRWDEHWLYVGAYLVEPHVWANLTKHDTVIFYDNDFEVFINPDGTSHYYKEYEMNANNVDWDLCLNKPYLNGGYENSSRVFGKHGWDDPDLKKAVYVYGKKDDPSTTDMGWSVEIAFPLKAINLNETTPIPPTQNQYWRINFSRVEWFVRPCNPPTSCAPAHFEKINKTADNWVWAPTGIIDIHLPEYWGYVQFSKEKVNSTAAIMDPNWTIRFIAMQLYYAELKYWKANNKTYTDDVSKLIPLAPFPDALMAECSLAPVVTLRDGGAHYIGRIPSRWGKVRAAFIRDDRYLYVAGACQGQDCEDYPDLHLPNDPSVE